MNIKIGCDLVCIKRFRTIAEDNGTFFLQKIFTALELQNTDKIESLAGIFAAKEATLKALEINTDNWLNIQIIKKNNGKPILDVDNLNLKNHYSCDVSISHDENYAFAVINFLMKD